MANRFQKFIYYFSAETPILLVLAIMWLVRKSSWKEPIMISWKMPTFLLIVSVFLVIVFISFFNRAKADLSLINITGTGYRSADRWLVAYGVTYLLPLTSIAWGDIDWVGLGAVLIILMLVLIFSDHVTPHPLLFCMGYHFYELDVVGAASGYTVISQKQIRNVADFKKVSRVFEFLLIRLG